MASFLIGILQMHRSALDCLRGRLALGCVWCMAVAWTIRGDNLERAISPGADHLLGDLFRRGKAACEGMLRGIRGKGKLTCPEETASVALFSIEPISLPDPQTGHRDDRNKRSSHIIKTPAVFVIGRCALSQHQITREPSLVSVCRSCAYRKA
jgi:hypothetical protein